MTLPLAPRLHTVAGRENVWKRKTLVSPWAKAPETPFPKRELQGGGGQDAVEGCSGEVITSKLAQ